MNCPRCQQPLVILELDRIEIDYCLKCNGVWLDAGELELLLDSPDAVKMAADPGSKEKSLRCPLCDSRMEKVRGGEDGEILLDRCKKGHGLWFDQGELESLLRREKTDVDNRIIRHLRGIFELKEKPRNKGEKR